MNPDNKQKPEIVLGEKSEVPSEFQQIFGKTSWINWMSITQEEIDEKPNKYVPLSRAVYQDRSLVFREYARLHGIVEHIVDNINVEDIETDQAVERLNSIIERLEARVVVDQNNASNVVYVINDDPDAPIDTEH